jgi:predicted DNA-binding transcriptional regulator AlpA
MQITTNFGLIPFAAGCEMLGVKVHTARRMLRMGADFPRPTVKIGRHRYYRSSSELETWLDHQATKTAALSTKGARGRAAA